MTPPIVIVLQTYKRTEYAIRTILAAREHLRYAGELLWYIADDGSDPQHMHLLRSWLDGATVLGAHSERRGYGGNANAAWLAADAASPLTLWLEDDWELQRPLDLTPFAQALADPEIGMVRLGYLNRGIAGSTVAAADRLYWRLYHEPVESVELVFTGHPSLRHTRYRDAYGLYPENRGPGDTELGYAFQYRTREGPWIVWPADWPVWGHFAHIGSIKSETLL